MLTLVEAAKTAINEGELKKAALIQIYAMTSPILSVLPFENIPGNSIKYNIEGALPGVGFRGVNEGYSESTGVINPQSEGLSIVGGDLDVDLYITNTLGSHHRGNHEAMKVKAMAHSWSNTFLKGDSVATPKSFDGLQRRLVGNQLVAAGSTAGGDALSLEKLDEVIDAVDAPTHLMMNKVMRRRLNAASRNTTIGGFIMTTKDAFGRPIMTYNDLPILVSDPNDSIYNLLAFNEACPGGGANVGTSIYVLSLGVNRLSGIQNGGLRIRDLGELESKPTERTRIEWYSGLMLTHPRAAARIWGIKNAAVVA